MNDNFYTITETAKNLGVSIKRVMSVCNRGLIPHIKRNRKGHRIFTSEQVELIDLLLKMRAAGFDNTELKAYSRLYREGESTLEKRLAMLTTRKHQLWQEIKDRQAAVDFIERQEELFGMDQKSEV